MSDTGLYKVVGRSAALAPEHYGKTFAYDESDLCSGGGAAAAGAAAVTLFGALLMFPPTRWALGYVLPKPGQAGGLLRTSTLPTLNRRTKSARL